MQTTGALANSRQPVPLRPVLVLTLARVEMQSRAPMYTRQVVKAVSMTLAPSSELMDMCHKHFITRVGNGQRSRLYVYTCRLYYFILRDLFQLIFFIGCCLYHSKFPTREAKVSYNTAHTVTPCH